MDGNSGKRSCSSIGFSIVGDGGVIVSVKEKYEKNEPMNE
jgi:hypothetical protein